MELSSLIDIVTALAVDCPVYRDTDHSHFCLFTHRDTDDVLYLYVQDLDDCVDGLYMTSTTPLPAFADTLHALQEA